MNIYISGHTFAYEAENVARAFFREVSVRTGAPSRDDTEYIILRRAPRGERVRLLAVMQTYWFRSYKDAWITEAEDAASCERILMGILYDILCLTATHPPAWGILTGVRPAKFAGAMLAGGLTADAAEWRLCADHRVAARKARLAIETAANGDALVAGRNSPRSYSLYVSIPFCPTRCSYCSFVSKTVGRDLRLLDNYIESLCEELALTAEQAKRLDLRLESVYIGGGTPTTLSAAQLETLTAAVAQHFPVQAGLEYTVEAGRPDTITAEKLAVLKAAGVTRVSVNPQTASDAVLQRIGRSHTKADAERAFRAAAEIGFDCINADLIAGLPGDDIAGFRQTLDWLLDIAPENITLHALTLKRASTLAGQRISSARGAAEMVDLAEDALKAAGYAPYYMYRQKGTVNGLENTGYAKPGTGSLYNLYMMDELHTVLACGAGGVTKLVNQHSGRIARVLNYKYPAEYISGFSELMARKERIHAFYESIV